MRSMKRGVKRIKNYRFNRNTLKNKWKREKQQRVVENANIGSIWDKTKTTKQNFEQAGLVYDLNKVKIKKEKAVEVKEKKMDTAAPPTDKNTPAKQTQVVKGSEEETSPPPKSKALRLSQPEVRYCIYMMEKYGEDYEAMAKDLKNENQDTPAQIRRKILTFKSVPMQYNAYLKSKGTNGGSEKMDTS